VLVTKTLFSKSDLAGIKIDLKYPEISIDRRDIYV